jgi:hypothetical protein
MYPVQSNILVGPEAAIGGKPPPTFALHSNQKMPALIIAIYRFPPLQQVSTVQRTQPSGGLITARGFPTEQSDPDGPP